jgi:hypothetical protein
MSVATHERRGQSMSGWDQMRALEQAHERQACSAMAEWLGQLATWDICAMLTYDPDRNAVRWPSLALSWMVRNPLIAEEHVRMWLVRCEQLLGSPLQAVFTQEYHRSGWPHWHGLLATGGISGDDRVLLEHEWLATRGYAQIARLQSPPRIEVDRRHTAARGTVWPSTVSDYCAKYLWKPEGTLLFHGFEDKALQTQFRQILGDLLWGEISSVGGGVGS